MASRSKATLPLPGDELLRMKEYLSPHYGSQVWQDGERRILVLRVPGEDPDMVNDVEASVEHLGPGDVQGLEGVLMVGSRTTVMMAVHPFRDLMQARVVADREQCRQARARLGTTMGHLLFRAQDDARRLWRLAIRIRKPRVGELDDAELERLAAELGPLMHKPGYAESQVVYLIADQDDVRIDAPLFLQDIRERHEDVERQERKLEEERQRLAAEKRRQEEERARILRDMEARFRPRVAYAPMSRMAAGTWDPESEARQATAAGGVAARLHAPTLRRDLTPSQREMYLHLDALRGSAAPPGPPTLAPAPLAATRSTLAPPTPTPAPSGLPDAPLGSHETPNPPPTPQATSAPVARSAPTVPAGLVAAASVEAAQAIPDAHPSTAAPAEAGLDGIDSITTQAVPFTALAPSPVLQTLAEGVTVALAQGVQSDPILERLQVELKAAGFDVMVRPSVPGHVVHLAAERSEGYPQRVICRSEPHLTAEIASEVLEAARELEVDVALVVAPEADPEAKRRLIATKAKHLAPADLENLAL